MGISFVFQFLIFICSAQVQLGFYTENSDAIPDAVREARHKIFKIEVPYYYEAPSKDYEALLKFPNLYPESKETIKLCQFAQKENCLILFGKVSGTAFLDEDPRLIWTNCHIVREWMRFTTMGKVFSSTSHVREFYKTVNVPLLLMSKSDGATIYSGQDETAELKVYSVSRSYEDVDGYCDQRDDLVKIELARPLSEKGLIWNKQGPVNNEVLFMGGFPMQTHSRAANNVLDSDGENFYWTSGAFLQKMGSEFVQFIETHPELSLVNSGPYAQLHFGDGVEGMSGSPVLSAQGEVYGTYHGYVPLSDEQKDIPLVSLFVDVGGMRFLEILSGE
jgi:hypothetical protein